MGKGKDTNSERSEHVSAPLSSLKDPASFGPPPKHIKYHGPAALPNETTPDRSGLGAPLRQEQISYQNTHQQQQQQAEIEVREAEEQAADEERQAAPPAPYRVDTTGLRTDHLPPPPKRVGSSTTTSSASSGNSNTRPKPSLPPRLPPRTNSTPVSQAAPTPPPAYSPIPQPGLGPASEGYVNQGATSRLANAGVSVPGLGIGGESNQDRQGTASPAGQAPVNELQSRFSQMRTGSSYSRPAPLPPSGRATGNTPAQHPQDDLPPASSSGGVKSKINNFREQHADKIDTGKEKMSGLSKRINTFVEGQKSLPSQRPAPPSPSTSNVNAGVESIVAQKKKPPPPPPKRAEMRAPSAQASSPLGTPPPLPLSTKPRFNR